MCDRGILIIPVLSQTERGFNVWFQLVFNPVVVFIEGQKIKNRH